jgi:hypothetical protein
MDDEVPSESVCWDCLKPRGFDGSKHKTVVHAPAMELAERNMGNVGLELAAEP